MTIPEVAARLLNIMQECHPENLGGREHSDDYDDLYRLLSWFWETGNHGGPLLPGDLMNRDNVLAVVREVNDYFRQMMEDPRNRQMLDDLYDYFTDAFDMPEGQ